MSQCKTIKIDSVEYVRKDSLREKWRIPKGDKSNPFMECGLVYFVRTVTHYFTGRLIWVGEKEIVFEDACWIADTGRFSQFLQDKEKVNEAEPFGEGSKVIIGCGSIIDMVEYKPSLILVQK